MFSFYNPRNIWKYFQKGMKKANWHERDYYVIWRNIEALIQGCFVKKIRRFRKIHRKAPVLESFLK